MNEYKFPAWNNKFGGRIVATWFKTERVTVSYTYFTPDTSKSKEYSDPKKFEKDLLKNTFTMKKYFFKYYERLNTRTI